MPRARVLLIGDPPGVDRFEQKLQPYADVEVIRDPHVKQVAIRRGFDWILGMNMHSQANVVRVREAAAKLGARFVSIPPGWSLAAETLKLNGFFSDVEARKEIPPAPAPIPRRNGVHQKATRAPLTLAPVAPPPEAMHGAGDQQGGEDFPAPEPTVMEQFDLADADTALAAEKEPTPMPETTPETYPTTAEPPTMTPAATQPTVSLVLHIDGDETSVVAAYVDPDHAAKHAHEDDTLSAQIAQVVTLPLRSEYVPRLPPPDLLAEALALLGTKCDESDPTYAALMKKVRRAAE